MSAPPALDTAERDLLAGHRSRRVIAAELQRHLVESADTQRCHALLAEASALYDPIGAREHAARAAVGPSPEPAAWSAAIGRLLGADVHLPAASSARCRALSAAVAVCEAKDAPAGHAAHGRFEVALAALPGAHRERVRLLAEGPLAASGYRSVRGGDMPGLLLVAPRRALWAGGEKVHDFGRSQRLYRLLEAIATEGERLDRPALYRTVWELPYRGANSDNSLFVAVRRLRKRVPELPIEALEAGGYRIAGTQAITVWGTRPPEAPAAVPSRSNLGTIPLSWHALVGREALVDQVRDALRPGAWVTLTGPPGAGKTHLAAHLAAATLSGEAGTQVWWLDGSKIASSAEFRDAARSVAGGDPWRTSERWLLILDRAEALHAVLPPPPCGTVLATAVAPMGWADERAIRVGPLDRDSAVTVLSSRARDHSPGFSGRTEDLVGIAEVAGRWPGWLVGLARSASVHSAAELRARLEVDRETGLLDLRERVLELPMILGIDPVLLAAVALFRGPFSVPDAVSLTQQGVVTTLGDLAVAGVLARSESSTGVVLTLAEPVRVVARHSAGQALRARWAGRIAALAETVIDGFSGGVDDSWARIAAARRADLLAVTQEPAASPESMAWCALALETHQGAVGGNLVIMTLLERCAADLKPSVLRARVHDAVGRWALRRGDIAAAQEAFRAALADADAHNSPKWQALALDSLGSVAERSGRPGDRVRITEQARERVMGDRDLEPILLTSMANAATSLGDTDRAEDLLRQALGVARATGNRRRQAMVLATRAWLFRRAGRPDACMEALREAATHYRAVFDLRHLGVILGNTANLHLLSGAYRAAHSAYDEALALNRRVGDHRHATYNLANMGELAAAMGNPEAALDRCVEALAHFDPDADAMFSASVRETMGNAYVGLGRLDEALRCVGQALVDLRGAGDRQRAAEAQVALGGIQWLSGAPEKAVESFEAALQDLPVGHTQHLRARARLAALLGEPDALTKLAQTAWAEGEESVFVEITLLGGILALPDRERAQQQLAATRPSSGRPYASHHVRVIAAILESAVQHTDNDG
jgi:tetratricopeptide (TPR) repeat protein